MCLLSKFHMVLLEKPQFFQNEQVLFFSRLAADVTGRTSPRIRLLAARSPRLLFAFGLLMTASIPGYLWYIKASPWRNDWAVTGEPP